MNNSVFSDILKKGKRAARKGIVGFATEDLPRYVKKAVRPAARFIKKNWRTRGGGTLLLETMNNQFVHKKRRRSMSKAAYEFRGRSKSPYRKTAKSTAVVAYQARRGASAKLGRKRVTFAQRRAKIHYGKLRSLSRKLMMANAAGQAFTMRRQGEAIMTCEYKRRSFYEGRLYNWNREYDGGVAEQCLDFGLAPGDTAANDSGFLALMPQIEETTGAGVGMNLRAVSQKANRFQPGDDPDVKIRMYPVKALFHWKNNSGLQVKMHFYVMKALQDIKYDVSTLDGYPTVLGAWLQAIVGNATGYLGYSNITSVADLEQNLTAYISDCPTGLRPFYKIVQSRKFVMQPGDEVKHQITQPGRTFSLQNLWNRAEICNPSTVSVPNGFYALKGDYVTFTILEGGIVHLLTTGAGTAATTAGTAWVDGAVGNTVDLIVTKQFKGFMIPQRSIRKTYYFDDRADIQEGNTQIQTIPAFTDTN